MSERWAEWSATKKIVIVGIIVLIVFGMAVCVATMQEGMGKFGSPERTAKDAILAYQTKDADEVCAYFTPIPSGLQRVRVANLFAMADQIKIENLSTTLILNEGVAAKVMAIYDMVVIRGQYINTDHYVKTIKLVFDNGKWKINEAF